MNSSVNNTYSPAELKYLELLSQKFPTVAEATTEIINLEAILALPKGTEHFLTDLHGECEAFRHVLKNASGVIRQKVHEVFGNTLRESEMSELCTLIYYPAEKLQLVKQREANLEDWYKVTLNQLTEVCRAVSVKYTRSKVRKMLPKDFSYVIQELLHESEVQGSTKQNYFNGIIDSIISIGRADAFIEAMSNVIQRLTIDRLHIIGDIFDRGPGPHIIFDTLAQYSMYDIQWGNHDILWMGAAAGNLASIANVIRVSARYDNLDVLEDGYGINLLPLARFAMEAYENCPCVPYRPKVMQGEGVTERDVLLMSQMHKAISVIQFKIEGQMIKRHPEYGMDHRALLEKIDYERGTIEIDGVEYPLKDGDFPTVDPRDPYRLTPAEEALIHTLQLSFLNSDKLQKHIRLLYAKGGMYLIVNSNLMYHASIPMTAEGQFKTVVVDGEPYAGRALLDKLDRMAREAYFGTRGDARHERALDYMWYLWCGPDSPFFDKAKMATLERYLIEDKKSHHEEKGFYYKHLEDPEMCCMILSSFGLDPERSHIISGHVPVKTRKGESPIKAEGKLLMIDGGFSKAYHSETGIAGYTLIYNSHGLQLVQHEPFESAAKAVEEGQDIISTKVVVEALTDRITVRDTTVGRELQVQIDDLKSLVAAYRDGQIKERK
ncbi:MAG: fructose-1,6-bisphosphatase [Alistipes sp.]|nr:fructose-1,6-bisphosphatase [Alistipes sp.]